MSGRKRLWIGYGLVILLAAALLFGHERVVLSDEFFWLSGGLFAVLGAISFANYRSSRDPTELFIAAGSLAAAVQVTLVLVGWGRLVTDESLFPERIVVTIYLALTGVGAVATSLVLLVPWQERRGRPPIQAKRVLTGFLGTVLAIDVVLLLLSPHELETLLGPSGAVFRFGAGYTTALAIIGFLFLVAAWRTAAANDRPSFAWCSAAALAGVLWVIGTLIPEFASGSAELAWRIGFTWSSTMMPIAAVFLLVGVLARAQSETGRMRRATDRADEVLGGRAEIASVIAHDIRSPVSSIKSIAASTIVNYDRLDDAQRLEFVGMIDREAQHVLEVVHQMSVALKIDAGTLELIRRPTAIATVVREAIDEAETDGHPVDVDAVPGLTADVDVKWLAEAIRQGIDNAAAFSPEGTTIRISIKAGDDGSTVIQIADEGPGIPQERHEEVFHRFARWRPPGFEDIPGSGLGLFICRGIVREHGGEATLENGAERGTILRILLPWSAD